MPAKNNTPQRVVGGNFSSMASSALTGGTNPQGEGTGTQSRGRNGGSHRHNNNNFDGHGQNLQMSDFRGGVEELPVVGTAKSS